MEDDNIVSLDGYRPRAIVRVPAFRRIAARATFFFDLGSPYTYLAAERADRGFPLLDWRPAAGGRPPTDALDDEERDAIFGRADELRLPLAWVPLQPLHVPRAMRVARLAVERGVAAEFVLAATRLSFAGSFDIEDPQILTVAGHVAGIETADAMAAAGDVTRDAAIHRSAAILRTAGATRLPAIRVGGALFCGEERLPEAVRMARSLSRPDSLARPDEQSPAVPDPSSQCAS